ncbi:MAG: methylmalonyl-CoA mutase family protein, partial [Acidimicrobiia bacterium]
GGAPAAIESGFQQREIEDAAYRFARSVDDGTSTVVGVNSFVVEETSEPEVMVVDPSLEAEQVDALAKHRAARDNDAVTAALAAVTETARGSDNLLYPMKDALAAGATLGEITGALLPVFGRYRPAF